MAWVQVSVFFAIVIVIMIECSQWPYDVMPLPPTPSLMNPPVSSCVFSAILYFSVLLYQELAACLTPAEAWERICIFNGGGVSCLGVRRGKGRVSMQNTPGRSSNSGNCHPQPCVLGLKPFHFSKSVFSFSQAQSPLPLCTTRSMNMGNPGLSSGAHFYFVRHWTGEPGAEQCMCFDHLPL